MTAYAKQVRLDHIRDENGAPLGLNNPVEHLDSIFCMMPNQIQAAGCQGVDGHRIDAGESALFALQLQHLSTKEIDREYPQYKATMLLPVQSESEVGATEYSYVVGDFSGRWDHISNYADDLSNIEVLGEKHLVDIHSYGGSYNYSVVDMERSLMLQRPLSARKPRYHREAYEQLVENIGWDGNTVTGAYGLLTHPGTTKITATTKAGGGTTWFGAGGAPNATADEAYEDLSRPFVQQADDTEGVEDPDTVILPNAWMEYIKKTHFTDNTGETVYKRFVDNHPGVMIEKVPRLKGKGAASSSVMVHYKRDPLKIAYEMPQTYTLSPPEVRNLSTIVNGRCRIAGVVIYKPLSVTITEGL